MSLANRQQDAMRFIEPDPFPSTLRHAILEPYLRKLSVTHLWLRSIVECHPLNWSLAVPTPPPDMPPPPHGWSINPPRAASGWPVWMKASIAVCAFVLAALVIALTVILVVKDEGPPKAQQYRDALPENGLALAEPKSDSDIDQTARWTCDLIGDFYKKYREPQTGTGVVLLLLITHDDDLDRLALAWDPQYVATHDLDVARNIGGLVEGQGRSVGILRDLYCPTIPFDKSAKPAADTTESSPVTTTTRTTSSRPTTTTRARSYPDMDDHGFRNSHASCDV